MLTWRQHSFMKCIEVVPSRHTREEDVCMQSVGPSLWPIMAVLMLEDKKQSEWLFPLIPRLTAVPEPVSKMASCLHCAQHPRTVFTTGKWWGSPLWIFMFDWTKLPLIGTVAINVAGHVLFRVQMLRILFYRIPYIIQATRGLLISSFERQRRNNICYHISKLLLLVCWKWWSHKICKYKYVRDRRRPT